MSQSSPDLTFTANKLTSTTGLQMHEDTQSYPLFDENDIEKLYRSGVFDTSTPGGLQSLN